MCKKYFFCPIYWELMVAVSLIRIQIKFIINDSIFSVDPAEGEGESSSCWEWWRRMFDIQWLPEPAFLSFQSLLFAGILFGNRKSEPNFASKATTVTVHNLQSPTMAKANPANKWDWNGNKTRIIKQKSVEILNFRNNTGDSTACASELLIPALSRQDSPASGASCAPPHPLVFIMYLRL